MSIFTKFFAAATVLLLLALCVGGWLLKEAWQDNATLKQSNAQLNATIAAKTAATRERGNVNAAVRKMAPADKLEKLK